MVNNTKCDITYNLNDKQLAFPFNSSDISNMIDWACLLGGIDIFEMIWYKYFKL